MILPLFLRRVLMFPLQSRKALTIEHQRAHCRRRVLRRPGKCLDLGIVWQNTPISLPYDLKSLCNALVAQGALLWAGKLAKSTEHIASSDSRLHIKSSGDYRNSRLCCRAVFLMHSVSDCYGLDCRLRDEHLSPRCFGLVVDLQVFLVCQTHFKPHSVQSFVTPYIRQES